MEKKNNPAQKKNDDITSKYHMNIYNFSKLVSGTKQ